MELKKYQKKVMNNLSSYIGYLNDSNNLNTAWADYWAAQDINVGFGGVPTYQNAIKGVPHICMKVPTGGGKTFMACSALKHIFNAMPLDKPKVVVWLVPSDSILTQTISTLSNVNHPYRQRLDMDFSGCASIYTKDQLLNGQNFSPDTVREMLTVCILSYASLRIDSKKKDVRKVYQENGNLKRFADYFKDDSVLLAETPDTALIQVLRQLSPVTVVDESHNAGSDLSVEMLNNLNPSFVIDLTATPRKNSNIISYVDARELKKENMVKLPVVVYNRSSRQSVIQDAIQLRGSIEQQAKATEEQGGQYIRPIVLFQAQPKTSADSETFDKIKKMLLEIGIPEEQIAIKTSKVDDLKDTNLMSHDCQIRYIITVNALKEGWDCPFAYILASLANKTSKVDVEQILGRILRQPYAMNHSSSLLNTSYVLTCSNDFHSTLENIVVGLNSAGFSRKDFRVGELSEEEQIPERPSEQTSLDDQPYEEDAFDDISSGQIKDSLENGSTDYDTEGSTASMIREAEQKSEDYNDEISDPDNDIFTGGELGNMLKQSAVQKQYIDEIEELRIPQFFMKSVPDLFGDEYTLLEPDHLSEGFSLDGADATISFELATGDIYTVDVEEQGDAVPKYKRASIYENKYLRDMLAKMPPEKKINKCAEMIATEINKNNRYATSEVNDYVKRIISHMTEDELAAMECAIPTYAHKIKDKITSIELKYRKTQFKKWMDSGKIICRESYKMPRVITPEYTTDSIPNSLYEAEKSDMNGLENKAIDVVVSLGNIKWWHRIIDRGNQEFRLNGFINHYPDFMIMTNSGNLVLLETKGDHLATEESKDKLALGRDWQAHAGQKYRYFMVFDTKDFNHEGSYTLDEFVDIIKEL